MKHVIDGVWGALAMLAPLQDGHSQVQLDSQLKFQKKPWGSEGVEPTQLLSNTFLGTLVPTVLKAEKVLVMKDDWSCTAASSPPTSAYSLPNPPSTPLFFAFGVGSLCHWNSAVCFLSIIYGLGKKKKTRAHSVSVKIWTPWNSTAESEW